MDMGMTRGAALAFLLTGAGASLPALGALLTVARARVAALYLGWLLVGSMLAGLILEVLF